MTTKQKEALKEIEDEIGMCDTDEHWRCLGKDCECKCHDKNKG